MFYLLYGNYGFSFVFHHLTLPICHENSSNQAQSMLICSYITANNQRDNALLAHHKFSFQGVLCSILWGHKHSVFIGAFQTSSISMIDLPSKILVEHGMRNLEIELRTQDFFCHNPFLHFLPFSCWYVFKMSGMGENTSDPSRAESRKRKDPDQVGPRLDHLLLEILREWV